MYLPQPVSCIITYYSTCYHLLSACLPCSIPLSRCSHLILSSFYSEFLRICAALSTNSMPITMAWCRAATFNECSTRSWSSCHLRSSTNSAPNWVWVARKPKSATKTSSTASRFTTHPKAIRSVLLGSTNRCLRFLFVRHEWFWDVSLFFPLEAAKQTTVTRHFLPIKNIRFVVHAKKLCFTVCFC